MSDLIERQKAIDAIHCDITVTGKQNAELVASTIGAFVDRIKALPSAQPELIEKAAYIRGFEQGRTQGMIGAQGGKK